MERLVDTNSAASPRWQILPGDALTCLREMAAESVDCCVTSPPYWGLRSYGLGEDGIGLEATLDAYLANLVAVFAEVRRVLKKSGTCWANMGDCYSGSATSWREGAGKVSGRQANRNGTPRSSGLKPKDLLGVPWRLAFALQAEGWWLRSAMPWVKRAAMPESCRDRPTSGLEYVFLLTKSERYYFDQEAVRQSMAPDSASRYEYGFGGKKNNVLVEANKNGPGCRIRPIGKRVPTNARNCRNTDLWFASIQPPHGLCGIDDELVGLDVNPEALKEAHYAAFPCKLVEPLIKAGCPKGGLILDTFAGSGTTLLVARRLGRNSVGIELSPAYCELARARILNDVGTVKDESLTGHALPLFGG